MLKKFYFPILAVIIVAGFYINSSKNIPKQAASSFMGDADAIGTDEDAMARGNYEIMLLRDPATGQIPAHIREKELAFAATLPNDGYFALGKTTGSALTWDARGPWNVGGRTRAFGIDVSNENNLVAGSCSGGMWRSTDQGLTWTTTTPITTYQSVSCLTQDTRAGHTNVWYYGTGEAFGASASGGGAYYLGNGIYKSTDSGKTWNILTSTTSASLTSFDVWGDLIWNIVVDAHNTTNDVVYTAAYGGIYKSNDGGSTWTLAKGTFGSGAESYFTDLAITPSGVLYVSLSSDGPQRGIFRSTDGTTFTNITPSTFPSTYNRVKIGISPSNEEQVYFLANTPGSGTPDTNFVGTVEWNSLWRYTYISGDGTGTGGSWNDRSANLPTTGGVFDKFTCQGSYDLVVKVKPNDTNIVFIGGTNVYRSTTGFADASHTTYIGGYEQGASLPVVHSYANHHPDQHELLFLPSNPNKMISSNDGGIFKTNDNTAATVAWTPLNNGYLTSMFYSCAIDHAATNDIIIGGAQDNGSWYTNSTSLTTPWVSPRGGDGSYCAIADNASAYYFSIQNGITMRAKLNSVGGIDSFARIDPIGAKGYQFINPFALDPNDNNLMYMAAGTHLWRNNNLSGIPYASNWDSISTNWVQFPDSVTVGAITAVSVCKTPANRVYIGTASKKVYRIDNANVGTPTKTDITSLTSSALFPGASNVSCIATDPNNGDHLMVVFSNYGVYSIYYSADAGATWAKAGGNLEATVGGAGNGPSIRWASIIPVSGGMVYLVGTSVGLFGTTILNGTNTTWTQLGTNTIGNSVVDMIDYRATDGLVVVATHSHGIFSSHITQVADVDAITQVAKSQQGFSLLNYPNPFSQQTTIQFALKNRGQVSINIFDIAGKLIQTVADEVMEPGEQKYSFTTGALPSGMYFCTVKTGEGTETTKLLVQR